MSIGVGAFAEKIAEDEQSVLYVYGGEDWNNKGMENRDRIMDGTIEISKECLVEPEIHTKLKRMPSGRKKLQTKRVHVGVDYESRLRNGQIIINNCSYSWGQDSTGVDYPGWWIVYKIFDKYQEEGKLPDYVYLFK